jgi:hypothetical protein
MAFSHTHDQYLSRESCAGVIAGLEDQEGLPWLREIARRYLSRVHRDAVAEGCPLPALSADVFRSTLKAKLAAWGIRWARPRS